MDQLAMAKKLAALAHADLDVAEVYEQVLRQLDEPVIGERLAKYRRDHLEHFQDLAECVVDLGADVPSGCPGRAEFTLGEFAAPERKPNLEGLLRYLYQRELDLRQAYREASHGDLSLKARALVDDGCGDETRHLLFLEETVKKVSRRGLT